MSVVTWGSLAKTIDDKETIEDHISSAINTHNEDASAHSQAGEPIYSHRNESILDHLDGSVGLQKLVANQNMFWSCFESLDGWQKSAGSVDNTVLSLAIQTGPAVDVIVYIQAAPFEGAGLSFSKDSFFQTSVKLSDLTEQIVYFVVGGIEDLEEGWAYGFKVEDGLLYALTISSTDFVFTEYKTQITGVTLDEYSIFRAFFDVSAGEIYFYVNGNLKCTVDTNLPTGQIYYPFTYWLKSTESNNKALYSRFLLWGNTI